MFPAKLATTATAVAALETTTALPAKRTSPSSSSQVTTQSRSLWQGDGSNTTSLEDAASCATFLFLADSNGDGIVDGDEFPLFVQQLASATKGDDVSSAEAFGDSYSDLPLELQRAYDDLACYFCVDGGNATAPTTVSNDDDDCCVGLYLMVDVDTDIVNGTLNEEDVETLEYLQLVCQVTLDAMKESWNTTETSTLPPRPPPGAQGRIDTCPDFVNPGEECSLYMPALRCSYGYIYSGCSWQDLGCVSTFECDCVSEEWLCLSMAMIACDESTTPEELPWGQICNPNDPLPQAPASS
jgi:hypothetical protein